jgi:CheY-like chemotaxis protein
MRRTTVLVAENNDEYREFLREFLEEHGFRVVVANEPEGAREVLNEGKVDLAVLDLRLLDDSDQFDISGLEVAKDAGRRIPKIILTHIEEPAPGLVRDAMRLSEAGLPPAVNFLQKNEGPDRLVTELRRSLRYESLFEEKSSDLAKGIEGDYREARRQAHLYFRFSLVVSFAGIALILFGATLLIAEQTAFGSLGVIAGVITEAISILFFRRADLANGRMDRYHRELLEIRTLENLLAACEESLDQGERSFATKERILQAAAARWFPEKEKSEGE